MSAIAALAERFADALDCDDFTSAEACLAADCTYTLPDRSLHGRTDVMRSFIEASAWAHANISSVTYTHTIGSSDDRSATIEFYDDFQHNGARIHHECAMHVTLGTDGLIDTLLLEEAPDERTRVTALLREAGVHV